MNYLAHTFNEIDVFHAVRNGGWNTLALMLSDMSKRALESHKKTTIGGSDSYSYRSSNRERELKAESILLPLYPMKGIFLMEHQAGSDRMLETLAKDTYVKRMDCSQLAMHMVQSNVGAFVWGLKQGWGEHFGLLQSRQYKMKWDTVHDTVVEPSDRAVVDEWLRHWSKRNPLLLRELFVPTHNECVSLLVGQSYMAPKQLKVLLQDERFSGFVQTIESLGQWDYRTSMAQKTALLRPYFTQEPVAQMALPSDFLIEP